MTTNNIFKKHFFGNLISEYGRKYGRVDYATLAKSFDAVLNNDIMSKTADIGYWELENGRDAESIEALEEEISTLEDQISELEDLITEDSTEEQDAETTAKIDELNAEIDEKRDEIERLEDAPYYDDIFQYFIISDAGAEILKDYTNEILFYNSDLDMYIWGVTHYGTSWDYVLTDIPCEVDPEANA